MTEKELTVLLDEIEIDNAKKRCQIAQASAALAENDLKRAELVSKYRKQAAG